MANVPYSRGTVAEYIDAQRRLDYGQLTPEETVLVREYEDFLVTPDEAHLLSYKSVRNECLKKGMLIAELLPGIESFEG